MESVAREGRFRLVVIGDGSVRTIALDGERWLVGRSPDCAIQLRDPTVSRQHVRIERRGDTFRIIDLGGRNPILIDGSPTPSGDLTPGQTLSIGLTRLVLQRREPREPLEDGHDTVMITRREVIDDELAPPADDVPPRAPEAQRILERIGWTFTDIGSLTDAAEPLLQLAMNLTGRTRGLLGRFRATGNAVETLAMLDTQHPDIGFDVPKAVIREAHRLRRVSILTTTEDEGRLAIPLGDGPHALVLLDQPSARAPAGQDLLRLADTLGKVIWHRLDEVQERLRLRDEVQRLRLHGTAAHNAVLASSRLQSVRQQLREVANAGAPVLLVGEAGTEREELARYLHSESQGSDAFVALHPRAVPEDQLERELFGDGDHVGATARAAGGTLFVEDIDALPPGLQERLATDDAAFRLVGGSLLPPPKRRPPGEDDEATARSEAPANTENGWTSELGEHFVAHVVSIPPLRQDGTDVVTLAELLLSEMGPGMDGTPRLLSERSKRLLAGYSWPGNVEELRHAIETAAAKAGGGQITPRHLPTEIVEGQVEVSMQGLQSLEEVERQHIRRTLKRVGGNRARAAQALAIAPSTLYDKLRRYSIDS